TRIITDDIVTVDFTVHPFRLTALEGNTVEALAVIVAPGARANYLGLGSESRYQNEGGSACAGCDGALPRFRHQPLVVVAGGDWAVEESTYLTKCASKVHLVHRRDQLRASKIMQQRLFANHKIEPKWFTVVEEVLGNEQDGVTAVRIRNTRSGAAEDLEA